MFEEMLALDFIRRALAAAALTGLLCGFVGFFVVLNRMSFLGVGLSHSTFGGLALGLVMGWPPLLTGAAFSLLSALGIGALGRDRRMGTDTAIGILFATAMALGIALTGFIRGQYVDLFSYLFGNVLTVSSSELWALTITVALVFVVLGLFFKPMLYISFDPEAAEAGGLPVARLHYLLLTLIALTVIVAVKVVGVILASAFLTIPPASALQLSARYRTVVLLSMGLALLAALGGLFISFAVDISSGAAIILLSSAIFALAAAVRRLRPPLPAPKRLRLPF